MVFTTGNIFGGGSTATPTTVPPVPNEAARLALTSELGQTVLQLDNLTYYIQTGADATDAANWEELNDVPNSTVANEAARLALDSELGQTVYQTNTNEYYVQVGTPVSSNASWFNITLTRFVANDAQRLALQDIQGQVVYQLADEKVYIQTGLSASVAADWLILNEDKAVADETARLALQSEQGQIVLQLDDTTLYTQQGLDGSLAASWVPLNLVQVADQAARLALNPRQGQHVLQLDTGIFYFQKNATATAVDDWESLNLRHVANSTERFALPSIQGQTVLQLDNNGFFIQIETTNASETDWLYLNRLEVANETARLGLPDIRGQHVLQVDNNGFYVQVESDSTLAASWKNLTRPLFVTDATARLALEGERGQVVLQLDTGNTYIQKGIDPTDEAAWDILNTQVAADETTRLALETQIGQQVFQQDTKELYIQHGVDATLNASWTLVNPANLYTQVGHGLVVGTPVHFNGTGWSVANAATNLTLATHLVSEVVDVDTIKVSRSGKLTLTELEWQAVVADGSSLVPGTYYHVAKVDGKFTSKIPFSYSNTMFIAVSTTEVELLGWAPQANASSETVAVPAGFSCPMPFDVIQTADGFTTDFDPTSRKITPSTIYYVDVSAGATGTGLTEASPMRFPNEAIIAGNATGSPYEVRIKPTGRYHRTRQWDISPTQDCNIIGYGGRPVLSSENQQDLGFALAAGQTNTYVVNRSASRMVLDSSTVGADGFPTKLQVQTSIAAVEANQGSYFIDGNNVYVHGLTSQDISVDRSNIHVVMNINGPKWEPSGAEQLYIEGIDIIGWQSGFLEMNGSGVNTSRLTTVNVHAKYGITTNGFVINDIADVLHWEPRIYEAADDGINYHNNSGTKVVATEYNAFITDSGQDGGDNQNASTTHDGNCIFRINGVYQRSAGRNIHDVGTGTESYNMGVESKDSLSVNATGSVNFYSGDVSTGTEMFLNNCKGSGSITQLINEAGSTLTVNNELLDDLTNIGTITYGDF